MKHFSMLLIFGWIFTVAVLTNGDKTLVDNCTGGQYFSDAKNICLPCSFCSNNDVVRKPCTILSDTVCGPFKEFEFFHQHSDNTSKDQLTDPKIQPKKTEVHVTIYSEGRSNIAVSESKESQHWRKVAFALIGALSGLIFLATLVVLVICRRMNVPNPARPPHADDEDADCPYVVIHTIRPSEDDVTYQVPPGPNALHQLARQRHRLYKYHPKRRLLQPNEYADDVFESEDSAGSRRRISLQAIPETGHSDNEGDVSPKSKTSAEEACAACSDSTLSIDGSNTLANDGPMYSSPVKLEESDNRPPQDEPVLSNNTGPSDYLSTPEDNQFSTTDPAKISGETHVSSSYSIEDTLSACIHPSGDSILPSCACPSENEICPSSAHSLARGQTAPSSPSPCTQPSITPTSVSPPMCSDYILKTPAPRSDHLEKDGLPENNEHVSSQNFFTTSSNKSSVVSPVHSVNITRVTSPLLSETHVEEDLSDLTLTCSLLRSQLPLVKTSGSG